MSYYVSTLQPNTIANVKWMEFYQKVLKFCIELLGPGT